LFSLGSLFTPDVRKSFLGNIGAPEVDKRLFLMLIMSQICMSEGEAHGGVCPRWDDTRE
jgi:hypothetical protein